jgi:hypothetical protein
VLFDDLMRQILMDEIPGLMEAQEHFQPPDQDWRGSVANVGGLGDHARAFVVVLKSVKS